MSRKHFIGKQLIRKHILQKANEKIHHLLTRKLFLKPNFINFVVYEVFSDFFQCLFICFNFYIIHICSIAFRNLIQNLVHTIIQSFIFRCSSLKATRIYECPFLFAYRVLIGPKISYFHTNISFKITKCRCKMFWKFIFILLHSICFTGSFPMYYCCKDRKNITEDYFEQLFCLFFKLLNFFS